MKMGTAENGFLSQLSLPSSIGLASRSTHRVLPPSMFGVQSSMFDVSSPPIVNTLFWWFCRVSPLFAGKKINPQSLKNPGRKTLIDNMVPGNPTKSHHKNKSTKTANPIRVIVQKLGRPARRGSPAFAMTIAANAVKIPHEIAARNLDFTQL
jgi:hypothetical protein